MVITLAEKSMQFANLDFSSVIKTFGAMYFNRKISVWKPVHLQCTNISHHTHRVNSNLVSVAILDVVMLF